MSQQTINLQYAPDANPEQHRFHLSTAWARLISAGTGGGKTAAGLFEALRWSWEIAPGSTMVIMEPTYKMLRRILLKEAIPDMLGCPLEKHPFVEEFNKGEFFVQWVPMNGHSRGTRWFMLGLDNPESAEGSNVDAIWIDEFRLIGGGGPASVGKQETVWKSAIRRLRGSQYGRLMGYDTGLWITTTPGSLESVTFTQFEDPLEKEPDSDVFRWSVDDNPFLSAKWKARLKAAHVPGTGIYRRFIEGYHAAVSLGSYAFDARIHVLEQNLPRTQISMVLYGVDFGWTNPTCILAIGFDGDFRAYILEEFYQSRCDLETIIKEAQELRKRWGPGTFWCDRSDPRSINEFVKAGLNARADESKRDSGIIEMGGRFIPQGGRPRIYVHKSCVRWISEVQTYDSEVKQNDHAMDANRYVLANMQKPSGLPIFG